MYDVIIVGARCAGATLARLLSLNHYKILLVDKYSGPGPTLSTHIIGETEIYDRLGIGALMENSGAPSITRMRVDLQGNVFESDLVVTPRVLGLRRELFDKYLLDKALESAWVTFKNQTTFKEVIRENGRVTGVKCISKAGSVETYYASVVIGADGRNSLFANRVNASFIHHNETDHLAVYYAYLNNIVPLPLPTIEWYWHQSGVVICNPIDKNKHCLAVMIPKEEWKTSKLHYEAHFLKWLQSIKTLFPRLKNASFHGKIKGVANLQSYMKKSYGEGWALVGDAGAHLHPITGVGIDNAVCSAEYLAHELHAYFSKRKAWKESMQSYEDLRNERIGPQYKSSLLTLARTKRQITPEQHTSLQFLCTFPSLVQELGLRIKEIENYINGGSLQ